MQATPIILANPRASQWPAIRDSLTRIAGESSLTMRQLDPDREWLDEVDRAEPQRLIVIGGDGTLSHVVESLGERGWLSRFEIGLVPGGTGNDFARSIGAQGVSLWDAYKTAIGSPAVDVDLIRVTNGRRRTIINAATAGFGGLVAGQVTPEDKQRWGAMAYWIAGFSHLASLPRFSIEIDFLNDTARQFDVFGLALASGRYVGGGFPVAPDALLNDGLLNVTVVPVMPMGELIAAGVDITLGRHKKTGRVATFAAKSVRIESQPDLPFSFDGESERTGHAEFSVIPSAIRIACHPDAIAVRKSSRAAELAVLS